MSLTVFQNQWPESFHMRQLAMVDVKKKQTWQNAFFMEDKNVEKRQKEKGISGSTATG